MIGLAKEAKYYSLGEEPVPFFYRPALQFYVGAPTFMIRTEADPVQLAPSVRARVRDADGSLLLFNVQTLTDATRFSLLGRRVAGSILGVTGLVSLLLAAIGVYGVVAYAFQQRTHEIGIRVALGAERRDVIGLVLGHGMKLTVIGMSIGLVASFGATRLLASFLYGVSPTDPVSFAATATVLFLIAVIASYLPARRIARLDPTAALRQQ